MEIISILIIAVSLSMDAFSLSLVYGTLNIGKKLMYKLSTIVGVYHFFMPLLGLSFGKIILKYLPIKPNVLVFIILFFIGVQMIVESFNNERTVKNLTTLNLLLFGFAVSIDSFSVGISLDFISKNYFICFLIFSICSFIFTYLGLKLGGKINKIVGESSTIIGGVILIILAFMYLF